LVLNGVVTAEREAVVRLKVFGPEGKNSDVDAVLDTGFTGHLTLSPEVIQELGLPLLGSRRTILADGSRVALDVHSAQVLWGDRRRPVQILAAGRAGGTLAGMSLIWDHRGVINGLSDRLREPPDRHRLGRLPCLLRLFQQRLIDLFRHFQHEPMIHGLLQPAGHDRARHNNTVR